MANIIEGTSGSETLNGTTADDNIYGFGGNDKLIDDQGDDWLRGGTGKDDMTGGRGVNDYWGGAGDDVVHTVARGAFSDDLVHDLTFDHDTIDVSAWGVTDFSQILDMAFVDSHGNAAFNAFFDGADHVMRIAGVSPGQLRATDFVFATTGATNQTGTANDDVLFGTADANILNGANGNDLLLGGKGNDTLSGGDGLDDFSGGAGIDTLSYAYSTDEAIKVNLQSGVATFTDGAREFLRTIENVTGSHVNDLLIGDGGKNVLDGGEGNDDIFGGGGKDTIIGGLGADTLTGRAGADIFVYETAGDSFNPFRDTITDFGTGADQIDLRGVEADSGQALHFIGDEAFHGVAGELQVVTEGSDTAVNADIDGNGTADFQILVTGFHPMDTGDFLL